MIRRLNMTCESDYSPSNEDKQSFQPGWVYQTSINYSSAVRNAFIYKSSKQLDSDAYTGAHATYGGGGYVYEFRGRRGNLQSNISQLHELGWIDGKTRAVIIQCSLYNPNAEIFTAVTLVAEFLSTGGIIPSARIEPLTFQGKVTQLHSPLNK